MRFLILFAFAFVAVSNAAIDVSLPRALMISIDGNLVELCIDGQRVHQLSIPNHNRVEDLDVVVIPKKASVLAVKCNHGNPNFLGLIAADTTGYFVSNTSWKCHVNAQPDINWCDKDFDDSAWPQAAFVANYGADARGEIAGPMPAGTQWIWTSATPGNDGIVYCRAGIPAGYGPGDGDSGEATADSSDGPGSSSADSSNGETDDEGGDGDGAGSDSSNSASAGSSVSGDNSADGSASGTASDSSDGSTSGDGDENDDGLPDAPKIVRSSELTIYKTEGDPVTLWAVATGSDVVYEWTYNGQVVSNDPFVRFDSVKTSDAGDYVVVASNAGGEDTLTIHLIIYVPPLLSGDDSVTIIANVGGSVTFTNVDVIAGDPTPTVTWYKDGEEVNPLNGNTIGSVTPADAGTYTVVAENLAGIDVHTVIVEVVEDSDLVISPSSPDEVVKPKDNPATLFCVVAGGLKCDKPVLVWKKDGVVLSDAGQSGVIVIKHVSESDSGEYECSFTDKAGRSVSKTIRLVVVDPLRLRLPVVEDRQVGGGGKACFNCDYERGTAPVSQNWYRNGRDFDGNSCIEPVDYRATATFICVRGNRVGDDAKVNYVNTTLFVYKTYRTAVVNTGLISLRPDGSVLFQVKAIGSVNLVFSPVFGQYENDAIYSVILGADNNAAVTISKAVHGKNINALATSDSVAGGVLSSADLRWFWVSVSGGVVSVGSGYAVGEGVLVSYVDAVPVSVSFLGVASGQGGVAVIVVYP